MKPDYESDGEDIAADLLALAFVMPLFFIAMGSLL